MFSDLNRFVQKTSKSLDILYDKRDALAAATLGMIEKLPVFKLATDKENISLVSNRPSCSHSPLSTTRTRTAQRS